jgi:RES domain-containing protein
VWTPEPADGRWQRGSTIRALYLADNEQTAWAEWYRHSSELGVPPQTRLPRAMWRFEVTLDDVADLTDPEILAGHGIKKLQPTRRQWPRTQPIGEAYWKTGRPAMLVPSAAHQGGRVLVIFRPSDAPPEGVQPVPRPRRYTDLPPLPTGLRT